MFIELAYQLQTALGASDCGFRRSVANRGRIAKTPPRGTGNRRAIALKDRGVLRLKHTQRVSPGKTRQRPIFRRDLEVNTHAYTSPRICWGDERVSHRPFTDHGPTHAGGRGVPRKVTLYPDARRRAVCSRRLLESVARNETAAGARICCGEFPKPLTSRLAATLRVACHGVHRLGFAGKFAWLKSFAQGHSTSLLRHTTLGIIPIPCS